MTVAFPNLFRPIKVGSVTLKNRIAVSAHNPLLAQQGILTREYVDYQVEKAKGGAGLIIMSWGISDPDAPALKSNPVLGALVHTWRRENIPYFKEIVAAAHNFDCRVFFQFGENSSHTQLGPSSMVHTESTGHFSREMSLADIRRMMDNFARCADVLCESGLDGIEMHGHGDLFSDFFSLKLNRRLDPYGGSRENRMRFFLEATDRIRVSIGDEMVLGARISVEDHVPGSLPLNEGVAIARAIAESGKLDYLNVDTAIELQHLSRIVAPMYTPQGHEIYACEAVKAVVRNIPIFTVGRIVDPEFAETVLANGRADVITMARALIADPELPNKAKEGRVKDIRPCLGDNQECMSRQMQGLPIRCTVNPAAGRETNWGIGKVRPSERPRKVTVIGGGPAGMEAARVAALRGHEVHLFDKGDDLGGSVLIAQRLPGRADIGRHLHWHRRQLEKHGVKITLRTTVTASAIKRDAPDAVVVATGAIWQKSGFNGLDFSETPGWNQSHVLSLTDVITTTVALGERVLIYDLKGFVEAPGTAELLATGGREVEIVTPFAKLGTLQLDLTLQWSSVMSRLFAAGVKITPDTTIEHIESGAVQLVNVHSRVRRLVPIDHVVIISGRVPVDDLYHALAGHFESHRVGDCLSPLNIGKAFSDGHEVGLLL
jgi:2,4-dienoyl-CoA reductase-like NADH-dependent reductase (Old Yellow Enzyme family)